MKQIPLREKSIGNYCKNYSDYGQGQSNVGKSRQNLLISFCDR